MRMKSSFSYLKFLIHHSEFSHCDPQLRFTLSRRPFPIPHSSPIKIWPLPSCVLTLPATNFHYSKKTLHMFLIHLPNQLYKNSEVRTVSLLLPSPNKEHENTQPLSSTAELQHEMVVKINYGGATLG